jgi:excisionase family DNA binding protein
MNGASEDGYISKSQLAERMKVSTRTIETWMRERKVPYEKIGRTVRFHWGDVRSHLSRQSRVAVEPRDHLRAIDGISVRLRELAASIREQQRSSAHKSPANLGNNDDRPLR